MLNNFYSFLNFLLFNNKKGVLLAFLITISFYKDSLAIYGISIDDTVFSQDARRSYAVRASMFDLDKQELKEVTYFTLSRASHDSSDNRYTGSIDLLSSEKTNENPIKSISFGNGAGKYIVLNENFDTQKYLIISKFPVYKHMKDAGILRIIEPINSSHEFNSGWFSGQKNLFGVYGQEYSPALIPTHKGTDNPIYRVISADRCVENKTTSAIRNLDMDHPSFEKGDLGEFSMDLFMVRHGLIKYPSKYGEQGFDGVYASPDGSIVYLTDSKWFEKSGNLGKIMNDSLSASQIESRKNKMRSLLNEYSEFRSTLDILQNPNARFYRAIYLLTDNGKRVEFLQEEISLDLRNASLGTFTDSSYSAESYQLLLSNLENLFSPEEIVTMAGHKTVINSKRDLNKMKSLSDNIKKKKWKNLTDALQNKGYSIQDFL